jgi:deoxyribose-phosphate aldolase
MHNREKQAMPLPNTADQTPGTPTANSQESQRLAQRIDHTKLTFGPAEDENQAIEQLCQEAKTHGFFAVCVRPRHVMLAKHSLQDSPVKVATVIGFPAEKIQLQNELQQPTVGKMPTAEKVLETLQAIRDGVDELDLVMNVEQLKQDLQTGSHLALAELLAVQAAAGGTPIKVIIEIDLLTPQEMLHATELCAHANMAMVKTSTGMVSGGQGATLEAVQRIAAQLKALNSKAGIKASGGIKNREQALAFLALGVQRLGTSSGVTILQNKTVAPDAY